ncbi:hypothetical protein OGH69_14185 [Flavobacterium sp. MFBS3-15]|uniref:hypothetical protein n=1 Tax=Flavobacterium sp. MFBS3-15 TaxID=2989816 RepID=UPI002235CFB2|nr:hypothetical protein [Flavobacterium sp. MFBS3-15]MCW4470122.1 hypothetical protein [Flavobacterium sp. MFBS3-15]
MNAKVGDTIHFKLNYSDPVKEIQIATNVFDIQDIYDDFSNDEEKEGFRGEETLQYKKNVIPYEEKQGNLFEFDYVIDNKSIRFIDIYFDYTHVMRFKIKAGQ